MRRSTMISPLACLLLLSVPAAASPVRYDVSYIRHTDLRAVAARKRAVAAALGPGLARALRIVRLDDAYGLVYPRRGDARGAKAAAEAHSRVLRRKGLGEAAPVEARRWSEVSVDRPAAAAAARRAGAAGAAKAPEDAKDGATAEDGAKAGRAGPSERERLERLVEGHVKLLRRQGRIAPDERTAWSVYDFSTGETLVEINADMKLQAASLVKPFLALGFMHRVAEGKLAYDEAARAQLERMIQHSDNGATNWVMRRLGGPAGAQALLRKHYGAVLRDVELKEYIPRGGRTYRNKASTRDYLRFLLALWRDELPGAEEIKRLMALPKRDRLRTGAALPDDVEVYSKTGSTSRLCGDIGVLQAVGPDGRQYAYALIGIIEKRRPARHYFRWLRARGDIIREMSGLVYRGVARLHGF